MKSCNYTMSIYSIIRILTMINTGKQWVTLLSFYQTMLGCITYQKTATTYCCLLCVRCLKNLISKMEGIYSRFPYEGTEAEKKICLTQLLHSKAGNMNPDLYGLGPFYWSKRKCFRTLRKKLFGGKNPARFFFIPNHLL